MTQYVKEYLPEYGRRRKKEEEGGGRRRRKKTKKKKKIIVGGDRSVQAVSREGLGSDGFPSIR